MDVLYGIAIGGGLVVVILTVVMALAERKKNARR